MTLVLIINAPAKHGLQNTERLAMNATLKQAGKLLELAQQKELTDKELQTAICSGIITDVFEAAKAGSLDTTKRDGIRALLGLPLITPPILKPTITPYTFAVNCRPLPEMIGAGKYDWTNSEITEERFPIKGIGSRQVESALFHFGRYISSEDAIKEMDKEGYRPAATEELLAFGEHNPQVQREFPIVELGSVARVHGDRYVLYLDECGSGRRLYLHWFDCGWGGYCRFLAVRK